MAIRQGNSDVSALYLGSNEITKVYKGATEIYSAAPIPTAAEFVYTGGTRVSNLTTRKYNAEDGALILSVDHGDDVNGIAVDATGNVYTGGDTTSNIGGVSATTRKYDSNGNLIWSRSHGARVYCITVDADGNVYTGGLRVDFSSHITTRKYDSDGTLLWSRGIGNNGTTVGQAEVFGIAVDAGGNVYITGTSSGNVTGIGVINTAKYDTNGNLIWAKLPQATTFNAIAVDSIGNVYLGVNRSFSATNSVFKLDSAGNTILALNTGNSNFGIAVDSANNIYLGTQTSGLGSTRKYDPSGALIWAVDHGSTVIGIAVDKIGNVYTTGLRTSNLTTRKYDSDGTLLWSVDHGFSSFAVATFPSNVSPFLS